MLRQRIASAFVGLAILALALFAGGPVGWAIVIAAASVVGVLEFYHFGEGRARPIALLGSLWSAALVIGALSQDGRIAGALIGGGTFLTLVWLLVRRDKTEALADFAWTVAGVLYVGWLSRYLVAVRQLDHGIGWILLALLTTFATDTAAYFIGRSLGRHKLAPTISPKKTVEGAIGGLVGGVLAAWLVSALMGLPLAGWQAMLLGLLVSVAAQLGDLVESMLKRSAGVKDSGRIMPGHGGILDRADSILFATLAVYYYVVFMQ